MLKRIIDASLRQKYVALALTALMGAGGVFSLMNLPINSLPDVTPVQVLVITKAGRYSPYDVERLVSFPIETSMNGLPDVKEVRSISQFGLSAVTVEFEEGTDIYFARQMVSQRLQAVSGELPLGVSVPQLGPISTALGEIYQYVVRGEGYTLTELRTIQDWLVAPQLKTVQGVTEINSFGGFVKQYEVEVDAEALRAQGIGLARLIEAIAENNAVSGGNYLEHNREQYIVRGFGQIRTAGDIEDIVVAKLDERPVYLRDVASVRLGRQLRQGAVTKDGGGEVVTGIVMMLRGGNGREVIQQVEARIDEVNQGLPEGVRVEKFYDQADLVDRTTETIRTNLLEGGFFVVAVLLLLLGEIRGALIVASVIPLSMLFAFIGMREFGLAANLMSLGAIDFGMVVDGSVVMIENMVDKLQDEEDERPRLAVIRDAAHEVARPIFFGVLIILMVYVPIATFSGMEGILFRPMAITVATAVFGSLILAFVYVPAMAAIVFRKGVKVRRNYLMEWIKPRYRAFLERFVDRKLIILGPAVAVFAVSIGLTPFLGTEFLPELDEGSILVEQVRMPSVTLDESVQNANWFAGRIMAEIPEIRTVVPKTGRSDLANDWMGVHQTDVWVILKPREEWRDGMTKAGIMEAIRPFLESEPGLSYNFTQPIAMRVDELTSGVKSDIAVKIYGEDLDVLNRIGEEITSVLPDLEGTDNFFLERTAGQPYLNIEIDREAIASFGLNVQDVQQVVEAGIGGQAASQVFEGQRRFDIVVRYPESMRKGFRDIMDVPIELPDGQWIPLSRVAAVKAQEGPREIARENGWRRVIVGINLAGIDIGSYVSSLQGAIDSRVDIPAGNFLEYSGAFEEQQRAMNHLYVVVPLALFIILGLLYMMFGEMRYALLIFLNLPFALSGGIFILLIRGLYLSVSASIGFVALFGVAVLNGVVLVEHLNDLRREGMDVRTATIQGAGDRLRPVLMTALVASLGFIPMAFNVGPGSEVQRPLASVVIGGLITATLLTLLVLPTLYNWMERDDRLPAEPGKMPAGWTTSPAGSTSSTGTTPATASTRSAASSTHSTASLVGALLLAGALVAGGAMTPTLGGAGGALGGELAAQVRDTPTAVDTVPAPSRTDDRVQEGGQTPIEARVDALTAGSDASALTVARAVELAESRNPLINRARQEVSAADGRWWQSFGLDDPRLVYFEEGIPRGAGTGFDERRWGVSQSLRFPLTTWYGLEQASEVRDARSLESDAVRTEVRAAVKKAYSRLVHARDMLRLSQEEIRLARELQRAVEARLEVGEASGLELMQTEVEVARAENSMVRARRSFDESRYRLFNAIGLDPADQSYAIEFPDSMVYFEADVAQEEALAGLPDYPGVRAADRELEAARAGVRESWSAFLPDLEIQYYRQDFGGGWNDYGFQLGFSVPLWAPLNDRGRIQEARAVERERFWSLQEIRVDLKREIERSWHSYEASREAVIRYNDVIRDRSEELLARTQEGYRLGEIDLLRLLDTQRTYLDSQRNYRDALLSYYTDLIDVERFLDREVVFTSESP